ncbi:uncharacterized protein Z520_06191 [Fonsecaea multimorphosa CBS 102226]|uniref:Prokaryotic-type class I peptide chain release factors domain-containing protein n=1 Tax=Fonsecaea multimorphosa CBS 102226 TaxID=1442371 RepID=A0A0D2IM66_9EURO|nr:uncharacterized protein Z520_06191 [Fonsecaea multimorphosa CBS 102226]KIX98111.1 hypothetical protein Z520_06191 [Fonsecaea multimorphosa CBS 102226]OAL24187.1 hypothetical protein AYO22_05847 [Fonsecaea multimorphosa]
MLVCRPLRRLYLRTAFQYEKTIFSKTILIAAFSTFTGGRSQKSDKYLPPRPTLPDAEIKHTYVKGTGPGGQKINKTNSAAQLTHVPTGIVVKCQATRSRSQNHNIAKRILAEKVELLEKGEESRAAKVVERKQRKKRSADKKKRRKYRRLAEEKLGSHGGVYAEEEDDGLEEDMNRELEGQTSTQQESNQMPRG